MCNNILICGKMTADVIDNAAELIRIINPQNLDNIRMIFSGNRVDLNLFTRTI